jgi:hypothetical protein
MSSTGKTPTHPNSSKKLPPAAAEVAQHEAAEVAQHEAAEVAEAAEAVQYEPAAAAVAEASQFGAAAAAAAAAVAGLAYNGRHWAGSGSANRVISAPKSDRAGLNRDPRYQVGSSSAASGLFTRRDTGPRSRKFGLAASFCIFQFIDKKKEHRHERCHQLV